MRNYWIYFIASLVSLIGSNFFIFTQGWYLLELTGERASVGLTWSLFFLPSLVLLPMVGILLDKFDLKKVIIRFEILKVVIFLVFVPLLKWNPDPRLVYLLAICYGIAFVPYYPSVYVMVKYLVPDSLQTRYSHVFELSLQVANIVGCVASGFIYENVGFLNLLLLSIFCIAGGGFGMLALRLPRREESHSLKVVLQGYSTILRIFRRIRTDGMLTGRQFTFGILHQFPQAVILVGNIPIILYVNELMQKGPAEFGVLDAVISISAAAVSLFWSHYHDLSRARWVNISVTLLAGLAVAFTGWIHPEGVWPYLWMVVYGSLLISSKILGRGAVVRMISQEKMGTYSTLFQTFAYGVMMILFFGVSALSDRIGVSGIFLLLGTLLVGYSALVAYLYDPQGERSVKNTRFVPAPAKLRVT